MNLLLVITHLVAFAAGSVGTYALVTRRLDKRTVDGHPALQLHREDDVAEKNGHRGPGWVALAVILACAIVVAIGVQAYLANQHDKTQRKNDQAYAECLTRWGNDFAETLQKRSSQTAKLQAAETRRDDAVDQVLRVVFESPRGPRPDPNSPQARALQARFFRVLREAVRAKRHLKTVRAETRNVQAANQYVLPSVACTR